MVDVFFRSFNPVRGKNLTGLKEQHVHRSVRNNIISLINGRARTVGTLQASFFY
ncbi:MAG TPA: hypothetical protein VFG54_04965 [Prolixibacteraceae bacterium]|nr:hypothetical protein [Prolixibacteraceae bacterium]